MEETSSLPVETQALSFSEFLAALIQSFDKEGLRPCILRNYEGFPASNVGGDVDFLIRPSELPRAIRALGSLRGIRIVGYAERHYVAHVFVEGVSSEPGIRALGLDFIWSLNWKGLEYLSTDAVLQTAMPRRAGDLTFLVPSPVHEAIISLLSSLLIGGWLKEKYFPKVQQTFAGERSEVIAALLPEFGIKPATRLMDSVIGGDRRKILSCVKPLRISLAWRSLLHKPFRSVFAVSRYYAREFAVRCTPETHETVYVSGLDNCGRTTIVEDLVPMLRYSAKVVERRHFGPQLSFEHESPEWSVSADPRVEDRSGMFASMARTVLWLVEEWLSQFTKRENLTLRIVESYRYDLLIDARSRQLELPRWFARIIENLLPSVDLWVLLDGTSQVTQSGCDQVPPADSLRQGEAYRAFVKTTNHYVILTASRPAPIVTKEAYAAIIGTLALRTDGKLRSRF